MISVSRSLEKAVERGMSYAYRYGVPVRVVSFTNPIHRHQSLYGVWTPQERPLYDHTVLMVIRRKK